MSSSAEGGSVSGSEDSEFPTESESEESESDVQDMDDMAYIGEKIRALKDGVIREGVEMDSPKVGKIEPNEIFEVLGAARNTLGGLRLQMSRGWVSMTAKSGKPLCADEAAVQLLLSKVPLLQNLDEKERARVADVLEGEEIEPNHPIVVAGDPGEHMYFLEKGDAVAEVKGETVMRYSRGDYFGELALLTDQPRKATVTSGAEGARCLKLGRASFNEFAEKCAAILEQRKAMYDYNVASEQLKDESEEESESEEEDESFMDEIDQLRKDGGVSIRALKAGVIREGVEPDSAKVGNLSAGEVFEILEEGTTSTGQQRIRMSRGWVSMTAKSGKPLCVDEAAVQLLLSKVPLLQNLDEKERARVADVLEGEEIEPNHPIVVAGDPGEHMYFLEKGDAVAEMKGETVMRYSRGDYFGELALLTDQPRKATVTSGAEGARCLKLGRASFNEFAEKCAAILEQRKAMYDYNVASEQLKDESEEESESEEEDESFMDEIDQLRKDGGVSIRALKAGVIREGVEPDSAKVGNLSAGEVFEILEEGTTSTGQQRIRMSRGWVSMTAKSGKPLCVDEAAVQLLLSKVPLLQNLDEKERARVADVLEGEEIEPNHPIVVAGDPGEHMYFLEKGDAVAEMKGETVMRYSRGDYFGELALLTDQPRKATVTSGAEGARCLKLGRASFNEFAEKCAAILEQRKAMYAVTAGGTSSEDDDSESEEPDSENDDETSASLAEDHQAQLIEQRIVERKQTANDREARAAAIAAAMKAAEEQAAQDAAAAEAVQKEREEAEAARKEREAETTRREIEEAEAARKKREEAEAARREREEAEAKRKADAEAAAAKRQAERLAAADRRKEEAAERKAAAEQRELERKQKAEDQRQAREAAAAARAAARAAQAAQREAERKAAAERREEAEQQRQMKRKEEEQARRLTKEQLKDESEEESESEEEDESFMDEIDQLRKDGAVSIRALKAGVIREGVEPDSAKVGNLSAGEVFEILEEGTTSTGQQRIRMSRGWVSMTAKSGKPLCVDEAAVQLLLSKVPLLQNLDEKERARVADVLEGEEIEPNHPIVVAGDPGEHMYFLEKGDAVAEVKGETVMRYSRGDYFGELALLTDQPRKATVTSGAEGARCLKLGRASFNEFAEKCAAILEQRKAMYDYNVASEQLKDESEEESESEEEDESFMDEIDQLRKDGGVSIRALKAGVIREGVEPDSAKVGNLSAGEVFEILEEGTTSTGQQRIRMSRGWVSMTAKSGKPLCVDEAAVQLLLSKVPLLQNLDEKERARVADVLEGEEIEPNHPIVVAGDPGEHMYFLEKGDAVAEMKGETVMRYSRGDYFGELALLTDQPRKATVTSGAEGARCLKLGRASFNEFAEKCAAILEQRKAMYDYNVASEQLKDESEEESESEEEDESFMDEIDQLRKDGGVSIRALKAGVIREGVEPDSAKVGNLSAGEVFEILEEGTTSTGQQRIRMSRGWVSMTAKSGKPLCVDEAAVQLLLSKVPLLQNLDEKERARVADVLEGEEIEPNHPIVVAGDPGEHMYFLEKGDAVAEMKGETVMRYSRGDYFGELALLTDQPRKATVTSGAEGARCLKLGRASFNEFAEKCAAILEQRKAMYAVTAGGTSSEDDDSESEEPDSENDDETSASLAEDHQAQLIEQRIVERKQTANDREARAAAIAAAMKAAEEQAAQDAAAAAEAVQKEREEAEAARKEREAETTRREIEEAEAARKKREEAEAARREREEAEAKRKADAEAAAAKRQAERLAAADRRKEEAAERKAAAEQRELERKQKAEDQRQAREAAAAARAAEEARAAQAAQREVERKAAATRQAVQQETADIATRLEESEREAKRLEAERDAIRAETRQLEAEREERMRRAAEAQVERERAKELDLQAQVAARALRERTEDEKSNVSRNTSSSQGVMAEDAVHDNCPEDEIDDSDTEEETAVAADISEGIPPASPSRSTPQPNAVSRDGLASLDFRCLPPTKWGVEHVVAWIEFSFTWARRPTDLGSGGVAAAIRAASLDGAALMRCGETELARYEIGSNANEREEIFKLRDNPWTWVRTTQLAVCLLQHVGLL